MIVDFVVDSTTLGIERFESLSLTGTKLSPKLES